ncbi:hypothetical protein NQ317_010421 [Molorchus minor]|uniref:Uncharacterized protein n=1 Tax=Molorchus minor TaxID=1323400 RepID=A0ABQ9JXW6_9CUCU|nr:hypothetical protein NQ317_010421 [Molorchus minor]
MKVIYVKYALPVSCSSCPVATPSVVTTLPGSRIIRQSSQPEASAPCCGSNCVHGAAPSTSLRQLRDHGDGIAGIAADSLRINGAMRNFRQACLTEYKVRWYFFNLDITRKNGVIELALVEQKNHKLFMI